MNPFRQLASLHTGFSQRSSSAAHSQRGQGLTEYALMVSLVAIGAIFALQFFGGKINTKMSSVSEALESAAPLPAAGGGGNANGGNGNGGGGLGKQIAPPVRVGGGTH